MLTLLHLLLLALEGSGDVAGVLFGQDAVRGTRGTWGTWDAQMRGLGRGLPQGRTDGMIEVLVVRIPLEANGGTGARATVLTREELGRGASGQSGAI